MRDHGINRYNLSFSSFVSDRLGELERDKARLSEQLIAQQREHLVREMDILKKSKSSKNLLKQGFKKLKGKIHVRRGREGERRRGRRE